MSYSNRKKARTRARLVQKFHEQNGLCAWCHLPMDLNTKTKSLSATYDHLEKRVPFREGVFPMRQFVVAHRLCNNARGYDATIKNKILKKVHRIFANGGGSFLVDKAKIKA